MSQNNIDPDSRYQASHEWIRPVPGTKDYVCGITAHAEHALGDVVFVELPAVGKSIKQGASFGVIESVKAASDLYLPLSGTITAVNGALADNPALVNSDPYGEGWLVRLTIDNPAEWDALLSPEAYARLLAAEA
jgi:glycine cleavage system H protein